MSDDVALNSAHTNSPRVAPTPITEADRERMRTENAAHDAEVEAWAKKQREKDLLEGNAPKPVIQSVADSIKSKLLEGDIHTTEEREAAEERLLNGEGQ